MRKLHFFLGGIFLLVILYFVGPQPSRPEFNFKEDHIPSTGSGHEIEEWLQMKESGIPGLKSNNQARILWYDDSLRQKTDFVLVYLHGFSASQAEGEPIHREFAKRYGMNLYLSRLYGHGVSHEDIFLDLTVENYVQSAVEAIEIGKRIGKKVILMSTSTGGTISLFLAGKDPEIHSLIMYSPNIEINKKGASSMSGPWGLQITRLISGGKNFQFPADSQYDSLYWTKEYRIEGAVALQDLLDHTMNTSVFSMVKQPVFMGYFYKNENVQDQVVVVDEMLRMFENLGTSKRLKRKVAFPEAGRHVIASKYKSEDWEHVRDETFRFAEEILGFHPIVN